MHECSMQNLPADSTRVPIKKRNKDVNCLLYILCEQWGENGNEDLPIYEVVGVYVVVPVMTHLGRRTALDGLPRERVEVV